MANVFELMLWCTCVDSNMLCSMLLGITATIELITNRPSRPVWLWWGTVTAGSSVHVTVTTLQLVCNLVLSTYVVVNMAGNGGLHLFTKWALLV